jgi:hypothetical protein
MREVTFLVVLLLLTGCAISKEALDAKMNTWMGQSANDLIASWGPPTQVIDNGYEGKILVYEFSHSYTTPGHATTYNSGNAYIYGNNVYGYGTGTTVYTPPRTTTHSKTRTFWVNSAGIIYRWYWKGR